MSNYPFKMHTNCVLSFCIGCQICLKEICKKRMAKVISLPKQDGDGRKKNGFIYDVAMSQVMSTHYDGLAHASLEKKAAFGAANPMSKTSFKRNAKLNDGQNTKLGTGSCDREIEKIKNGKEKVYIASAADERWGHKRKTRYV
eukprot:293810_1